MNQLTRPGANINDSEPAYYHRRGCFWGGGIIESDRSIIQHENGNWYKYVGNNALPYAVIAGTTLSDDWVSVGNGSYLETLGQDKLDSIVARSFDSGFTLESNKEFAYDAISKTWYFWKGSFPKIVPAGFIPDSDDDQWGSLSDLILRREISDPDSATKYPEIQIGRWRDEGDVRGWGAGEAGFNAAMAAMSAKGGGVLYVREDITFTAIPIMHLPKVTVRWEAVAKVKTGLTADYAYIMDGGADTPSYDNKDHFTRANKTNCYNLYLMAEDYLVGINAKALCVRHCYGWEYTGGALIGFNNGGVYETNNYEGKASRFTLVVANTRLEDSIGFESNSTDSWFSEFSPVGYSIGAKFNKSGNSIDKFHPWGNTVDNLVGAMGKMNIALIITETAGFSTYKNLILDTPVRKNTNNPPSRSNGGVGIICDAWDAVIDGCLVLPSKNDVVPKSTLPAIVSCQRTSFKDIQVSNATFVTDQWISFESNAGIALNHFSGSGYAESMRNGMTIGPNSGAAFAAATGVTLASQALSSGIWLNTLNFSINTTVTAEATATSEVTMNLTPIYGVKSGSSGFVKGGMFTFFYASTNTGKQLYDVSVEIVSANTAKFLLTFIDGSTRYARWTDVSSGSSRQISVSGVIQIK